MTKLNLPDEPTYFMNFNQDLIEPLIEAIIQKYEIQDAELDYLKTAAIQFPADRVLFWRPEFAQFHYVVARGGFLNYCWLSHDQPRVEVLDAGSTELVHVYTDKINMGILHEFDVAHNKFD